jgi:hypothetical protein
MNGDRETKIVLVASAGLIDFVRNTIESIRRCGIDPSNIQLFHNLAAEPELQLLQRSQKVNLRCIEKEFPQFSWPGAGYMSFGGEEFATFTAVKWLALSRIISEGAKYAFYSDVDICWRRDPIPYLSGVLASADVAVQHEGDEALPLNYCCGFICFKRSLFSIMLLKALFKTQMSVRRYRPDAATDQIVFRKFAHLPYIRRRVFALPNLLFPSGLLEKYFLNHQASATVNTPMIFHANWAIGLDQKRDMLRRTGHWLV